MQLVKVEYSSFSPSVRITYYFDKKQNPERSAPPLAGQVATEA
jgi:hypothetical protein